VVAIAHLLDAHLLDEYACVRMHTWTHGCSTGFLGNIDAPMIGQYAMSSPRGTQTVGGPGQGWV